MKYIRMRKKTHLSSNQIQEIKQEMVNVERRLEAENVADDEARKLVPPLKRHGCTATSRNIDASPLIILGCGKV